MLVSHLDSGTHLGASPGTTEGSSAPIPTTAPSGEALPAIPAPVPRVLGMTPIQLLLLAGFAAGTVLILNHFCGRKR